MRQVNGALWAFVASLEPLAPQVRRELLARLDLSALQDPLGRRDLAERLVRAVLLDLAESQVRKGRQVHLVGASNSATSTWESSLTLQGSGGLPPQVPQQGKPGTRSGVRSIVD